LGTSDLLSNTNFGLFSQGMDNGHHDIGGFEKHTKGFGSKLLKKFGWIPGEGLGARRQGLSRPIAPTVNPGKTGLISLHDHPTPKRRKTREGRHKSGAQLQRRLHAAATFARYSQPPLIQISDDEHDVQSHAQGEYPPDIISLEYTDPGPQLNPTITEEEQEDKSRAMSLLLESIATLLREHEIRFTEEFPSPSSFFEAGARTVVTEFSDANQLQMAGSADERASYANFLASLDNVLREDDMEGADYVSLREEDTIEDLLEDIFAAQLPVDPIHEHPDVVQLQVIISAVQRLQSTLLSGAMGLTPAAKFRIVSKFFTQASYQLPDALMNSSGLNSLAIILACECIVAAVKQWVFPSLLISESESSASVALLQQQTHKYLDHQNRVHMDMYEEWKSFLQPLVAFDNHAKYSNIVQQLIVGRIKQFAQVMWSPRLPKESNSTDIVTRTVDVERYLRTLMSTWTKIVNTDDIVMTTIAPRLSALIRLEWDPRVDLFTNMHLSSWIHSYRLLAGELYDSLTVTVITKIRAALRDWEPSDSSARQFLKYFVDNTPVVVAHIIDTVIFPRLMAYWKSNLSIDPSGQSLEIFFAAMCWCDLLKEQQLVRLLVEHFFPKWHFALRSWLFMPGFDVAEAQMWYEGWKETLKGVLGVLWYSQPIMQQVRVGLHMLNRKLMRSQPSVLAPSEKK
jgi:hypothetical protein